MPGLSDSDVGIAPDAAPPVVQQSGLSDADLGIEPSTEPSAGGVARQVLSGAQTVGYGALAAPYNAAAFIENQGVRGLNAAFGTTAPGVPYLDLGKLAGKVTPQWDPSQNPPMNEPERIGRMAGAGAMGAAVAPAAGIAATGFGLGKLGSLIGTEAPSAASVAGGALGGAGAQFGAEEAPNFGADYPLLNEFSKATASTIGGLGGGLAGAGAAKFAPELVPTGANPSVLAASQNLRVPVPSYLASDNPLAQRLGQTLQSVPIAGSPLEEATRGAIGKLGQASQDIAGTLGAGDTTKAGEAASAALKRWIGPVSQANVQSRYQNLNSLMNPNIASPLPATFSAAQKIVQERADANLSGNGGAVGHVLAAITNPTGLTYQGMQNLRSSVGEMINGGVLPADTSQSEMKRIYAGLTSDLRGAASNAGGPQAVAAFDQANAFARATAIRRQALAQFLGGPQAGRSDEAVYSALQRAASTGSSADIKRLQQAHQAISAANPGAWDELLSGMIAGLGNDAQGNFSPARFLTGYSKISDAAKDELFGAPGAQTTRESLNSLATLSDRFKDVASKYGNPSGTGHVVALVEGARELAMKPIGAIATIAGGRLAANALAQPATASSIANFGKTYASWLRAPSDDTLRQMRYASARVSSAMAARFGAQIDPGALMNAATSAPGSVAPAQAGDQQQEVPPSGSQ